MLQAFTKRFCLLTVVLLLSVVNALAQTETAYGGGALPAAPTIVGDVWNVTAANAQYVLDGAYGSIDGKTINFTESIDETLEFGRPTKYVGSNSKYYRTNFGTQERTLEFMIENFVDGNYTNCYTRSISNVTFTADKGVTLNGFLTVAGDHVTGPNVYDYVIDYLYKTNNRVLYATAINGVTFDGITFTGRVNNKISYADGGAKMRNFTFKNCTFNIGSTADADGNQAIRHYSEIKNDYIVSNLVVKDCVFNTVRQGVYTMHVKNITVDGCEFNTTGHNAVAVQNQGVYDHGNVVITNNRGTNIGDRAIRLNYVGSDTQFTITGNNFTIAEGKSEEWIKATSLAEGITYNVANNTWTNFLDAYNPEFRTQVPSVAEINGVQYETLEAAIAAVPADGTETTITMLADESIEGNAGLTIAKNQNIVLDLNGFTIQNLVNENKASQVFKNNGTLSIEDSAGNGVLKNNVKEGTQAGEWWSTPQYNYATNVITNTGTLYIKSGTIQQTASGSICYAVDNNSNGVDAILNVEGGNLTSVRTVVRQFCNSTTKQNELNISGGIIETAGKAAIWTQLPGSSSASKKLATINITGGKITGGQYAWYDYSYGDSFEAVSYSISGGTFTGEVSSDAVTNGVKEGFITGGTFSVNPTAFVAEGYVAVENSNGTYTVQKVTYVAQVGDEKYASLAAAFAASDNSQADHEIKLLCDVTLTEPLNLNLGVSGDRILDLGNHTLTGRVNLKSGGLTVQNGTLSMPDGQPLNVYGSATPVEDGTTYSYLAIRPTVTINGAYGICVFGPTASSNPGYGVWVEMAGVINATKEGGIFVSGNLGQNIEGDMNNTVLILGTINGNDDAGVALNGNATVYVYDGAVITGNTAIAIKRGVLNVEGGTITSTGDKNYSVDPNNNGTEMTGAGISMTATYNDYGSMAVNISGGTITSANADALYKKDGTYTNAATFAVSGGTFSSDPTEFVVTGYEAVQKNDVWKVGEVVTGDLKPETGATETAATYTVKATVQDAAGETLEEKNFQTVTVNIVTEAGDKKVASDAQISKLNMETVVAKAITTAAATAADKDINVSIAVVANDKTATAEVAEGTVVFEVHPEATITVNEGSSTVNSSTVELANSDLADGASFTFTLNVDNNKFTEGATVQVVHKSDEFGDETFYKTVSGGKVSITVTHFSIFELSAAPTLVAANISAVGFATFSSTKAVDFTGIDAIHAYTATMNGKIIEFTRIRKVPANTGLLIRNPNGAKAVSVGVPVMDPADAENNYYLENNALVAVKDDIADGKLRDEENGYSNFILNKVKGVVGFYRPDGFGVDAGRAYLHVLTSSVSGVQSFTNLFDGETTAIDSITTADEQTQDNVFYDLSGRRVNNPQRGLYIVNGKKVLVK